MRTTEIEAMVFCHLYSWETWKQAFPPTWSQRSGETSRLVSAKKVGWRSNPTGRETPSVHLLSLQERRPAEARLHQTIYSRKLDNTYCLGASASAPIPLASYSSTFIPWGQGHLHSSTVVSKNLTDSSVCPPNALSPLTWDCRSGRGHQRPSYVADVHFVGGLIFAVYFGISIMFISLEILLFTLTEQSFKFLNNLCNPRIWKREAGAEPNKSVLHERKVASLPVWPRRNILMGFLLSIHIFPIRYIQFTVVVFF